MYFLIRKPRNTHCKILIIRLIFVQKAGLFFGGAYFRRGLLERSNFAFQSGLVWTIKTA